MINGSPAFNNAVIEGGHPYIARLSYNNQVLDCNITSCKIYKGSTGNDTFGVGNIFVPYIEVTATNLVAEIYAKELKLEIGVIINDEQTEWIDIGFFTVSKVSSSTISLTFTGVGRIAGVLPKVQVVPVEDMTLSQFVQAIQAAVRSAGYSSFTVDTSAITLSTAPLINLATMNAQSAIEFVAGVTGSYATEDNAGNIVFFNYTSSSYIDYDSSRMIIHPVVQEKEFELNNIKVVQQEAYEEDDGTIVPEVAFISGEPYEWVIFNSNMTEALFTTFCQNCLGVTYKPASLNFAYGDPRLEAVDVLRITDSDGAVYIIPCMSIIHSLIGGIITEIVAPFQGEGEVDSTTGKKGPLTQQIDSLGRSVMTAEASAAIAKQYAAEAKETTDEINAYAETVQKTVTQILYDGEMAGEKAAEAQSYANEAFSHLGVVENILGVVDLIANHGQYSDTPTEDEEVISGKWYFTQSYELTKDIYITEGKKYYTRSDEEPYVYTEVENPVVEDIGTYYEKAYSVVEDLEGKIPKDEGWYELVGTDVAIQNYVASHLVLDQQGLWLQGAGATKILMSSSRGIVLYGNDGELASYGEKAVIGGALFHIEIDDHEIGFYRGYGENAEKVAYMNGSELYVENQLSFGNFAFTQRANGHFTLKILGEQ